MSPVGDVAGLVARVALTLRDITTAKGTEERFRHELAGREDLIREADYRIKNSLQMVARLQGKRWAAPAVAEALGKATARAVAVTEAHRDPYGSPDPRTVDLCQVLVDLAEHLGGLSSQVAVRCASRVEVPIDAERGIPLGLIVSELLTNAIEHAYRDGESGTVEVILDERDDIVATVADNGRGMPPDRPGSASDLGAALASSLAHQVGALVNVETRPGGGTRVRLTLPRADPRRTGQ